jgi:hypothetical protein
MRGPAKLDSRSKNRAERRMSRHGRDQQQGARGHDPVQLQAPAQIRGQGDEHRTVSPARARVRDLPPQHRDLVPQHEDLRILGGVTARLDYQLAEHPDHEQADEPNEHER